MRKARDSPPSAASSNTVAKSYFTATFEWFRQSAKGTSAVHGRRRPKARAWGAAGGGRRVGGGERLAG
jgi:hypothetical protein